MKDQSSPRKDEMAASDKGSESRVGQGEGSRASDSPGRTAGSPQTSNQPSGMERDENTFREGRYTSERQSPEWIERNRQHERGEVY